MKKEDANCLPVSSGNASAEVPMQEVPQNDNERGK